jgi:hypothetical protein
MDAAADLNEDTIHGPDDLVCTLGLLITEFNKNNPNPNDIEAVVDSIKCQLDLYTTLAKVKSESYGKRMAAGERLGVEVTLAFNDAIRNKFPDWKGMVKDVSAQVQKMIKDYLENPENENQDNKS